MSIRTFEPIKTNVLNVLNQHLAVPRYQRPYTWKTDAIDLLWEDIGQEQSDSSFLGIIVLHDNSNTDPDGTKRIQIIDGQQRITTITIILALIRNLAYSIGDPVLASTTQKAIEQSNALGSTGFILKTSSKLDEFFKTYIQDASTMHDYLASVNYSSLSDEQEKVVRNYRKMHDLIVSSSRWTDEMEGKVSFLTSIKDRLLTSELIEVTVTSEDDAYDLFETLNSRSVSLSEVNMIKNRVFMTLSANHTDDELEAKWHNLEMNAGGNRRNPEDIQKFINYFWWSRYKKIPPRQIFRALRSENMQYMLNELEKDSSTYSRLRSNDSSLLLQYRHINLTDVRNLAQILKLQQVYIPLLSLARKFELEEYWDNFNNKIVSQFIAKLEKFMFAYKFSERSPAAVERMYSSNAIEIYKSKNRTEFSNALLEFEKEINQNYPTEEEFKKSFAQLQYTPGSNLNAIISYALNKIYFGDTKEIIIGEADIEHIFPRRPEGGFLASESTIEPIVNALGNLTPLAEHINRTQCQNKRPKDKMPYYYNSNIPRNHDIAKYIDENNWSQKDIEARTTELIDELWNYLKP